MIVWLFLFHNLLSGPRILVFLPEWFEPQKCVGTYGMGFLTSLPLHSSPLKTTVASWLLWQVVCSTAVCFCPVGHLAVEHPHSGHLEHPAQLWARHAHTQDTFVCGQHVKAFLVFLSRCPSCPIFSPLAEFRGPLTCPAKELE